MGIEERRFPRVFMTSDVELTIGGTVYERIICRDFSVGGMFVIVDADLRIGEHGTVRMTQQCGNDQILFAADFRVVRKDPDIEHGWGLEFTEMTANNRDSLALIVDFQFFLRS